jgi:hypothetical protein
VSLGDVILHRCARGVEVRRAPLSWDDARVAAFLEGARDGGRGPVEGHASDRLLAGGIVSGVGWGGSRRGASRGGGRGGGGLARCVLPAGGGARWGGSPAVIGSCSRQATGACVHGGGGGRRLGARRRGGGRRGRGAGRVGGGSGGADGAAGSTGRDGRGGGGGGQRVAMEGVVDPVACPMGDTRRPSDGRSPRGRGPVVGRARGGGEERREGRRRSCTSYNAGGCCAHRTPHYTALAREPTHIHMQFLTRMQDADRTPPLKV